MCLFNNNSVQRVAQQNLANLLLQSAIGTQQQQQASAQAAQAAAASSIANANLDTESSRVAAEDRMRRAAMAQGFSGSIFGGLGGNRTGAGVKMLFGA